MKDTTDTTECRGAARVRIAFARGNLHDSTPAVARALEAGRDQFSEVAVFCWNRTGIPVPARETRDGVEIHRFTATAPGRSLRILLVTLWFQAWLIAKIVRFRPAVVQATEFESALAARFACLLVGARLIYDMRDPIALAYPIGRFARRVLYAIDWLLMGSATAFVIPDDFMRDYLARWGRKSRRKLVRVRNTCHDVLGEPPPANVEETTHGRPVRVAFLGYLDAARGADTIFDAVKLARGRAELIAAGTCRSSALLERLKSSPHVRFQGSLPYRDALTLMRDSDLVAILLDPRIESYRLLSGPTKFFEAMMAGTPVVVSEGTELANLVRERRLGYVVPYSDSNSLANVLEDLGRPGVREAYRSRCREHYLAHFQLSTDIRQYREFYRDVLSRAA